MRVKGNWFDVIWVFDWMVKRLKEYSVIGCDSILMYSFEYINEFIILLMEYVGEGFNIFVREKFGLVFSFESELRDLVFSYRWELEKVFGEDELDIFKGMVIVVNYMVDVVEFVEEWGVNY